MRSLLQFLLPIIQFAGMYYFGRLGMRIAVPLFKRSPWLPAVAGISCLLPVFMHMTLAPQYVPRSPLVHTCILWLITTCGGILICGRVMLENRSNSKP
jgi:hypothetical protein